MKHLLGLFLLMIPVSFMAQNRVVVEYNETEHFEMPEEAKKKLEAMGIAMQIPDSHSASMLLKIVDDESIYIAKPEKEEGHNVTGEGVHGNTTFSFKMMREGNNDVLYKNLKTGKKVHKHDLMGKTFLIQDKLDNIKWKVKPAQVKILDYVCMEATATVGDQKLKAYFTPQIPLSNGPAKYGGLPGLILKVDVDDGKRVFMATSVIKDAEIEALKIPEKGKKVSQAQFEEIQKKKLAEHKELYGDGGVQVITIEN